ncbi:peptidase T [Clostridium oryzae]|uniref:Peptidase T n=1 Tax=Clostridium oryzae TaxID=1450648 RepID=A0A1V4IX86_9CLOT|nr:peptidase T [Clostridium oryzae]OPJ64566.1 peptidase T [Clostridium oryzae]
MTTVIEKFLKYVKFDTQSDEEASLTTFPSTKKQLVLAKALKEEIEAMGLKNVSLDDNGYLMAELPSNIDKKVPVVGFIAHMDTSPDMSGKEVKPQIVKNYNGQDIVLNKEKNIVLKTEDFPEIKQYIGEDIITSDGTTLLGADDKAGVAEIMTAMEYLIQHPEIKHGTIKIGFTPDEEVGRGADFFDVEKFGADAAYTMDGGRVGEFEYENFNAAGAKVTIHGRNVHPGYALGKMKNSIAIANDFIGRMPVNEVPERTSGYEGFYHLNNMQGDVEQTVLHYIIRDFDRERFEKRKEFMKYIENELNQMYGEGTVVVEVKDQYYNMKEKIDKAKYVVDLGYEAIKSVGLEPVVRPIRGGTDGARLSFLGLPTPNIFTGGENFHGRYEYIPIKPMEKAVEVIVKIAQLYVNK